MPIASAHIPFLLKRSAMNTSLSRTAVTDDVVSRKAGRKKPGDKVSVVMHEFNTGDLKLKAGKAKKACDCADKKSCNC